jgi:hypothetical protein
MPPAGEGHRTLDERQVRRQQLEAFQSQLSCLTEGTSLRRVIKRR